MPPNLLLIDLWYEHQLGKDETWRSFAELFKEAVPYVANDYSHSGRGDAKRLLKYHTLNCLEPCF